MVNTNISYFLEEHGWSTCWIYINHNPYEIAISHSFNDPIFECVDALIHMMTGSKTSSFKWYSEPGGDQIILNEISNKQHCVQLQVINIDEDWFLNTEDLKSVENPAILTFDISKIQLVRMFYYEFKKISVLMKDKHFALNRKYDFPFTKFLEFEIIALEYIN